MRSATTWPSCTGRCGPTTAAVTSPTSPRRSVPGWPTSRAPRCGCPSSAPGSSAERADGPDLGLGLGDVLRATLVESRAGGSRWTTTLRAWSGAACLDPLDPRAYRRLWVDVHAKTHDLFEDVVIRAPRLVPELLLAGRAARRRGLPSRPGSSSSTATTAPSSWPNGSPPSTATSRSWWPDTASRIIVRAVSLIGVSRRVDDSYEPARALLRRRMLDEHNGRLDALLAEADARPPGARSPAIPGRRRRRSRWR